MTSTLKTPDTDEYIIYSIQDDQVLTWNAKLITDLPNYYITDCGRVYSTNIKEFLKPSLKTGYQSVVLTNLSTSKRLCIHRLVAQHFVDNSNNKPAVDHKDRDKLNNHV